MLDLELIVATSSYAGIFALMIANGFLSVPSSQVLYIIVGYFIGTGYLALIPAALMGALGNTLGNIVLYEAVRRHGIRYLERFRIFRAHDIEKIEAVFRKKGLWFLFVGKLLPAIKVFIPIPAAIGRVHRGIFALIMFVSSYIWALAFISIGYVFGKSAEVWKSYGVVLAVVALIVGYLFYRMLQREGITFGPQADRGDRHSGDAEKPPTQ